MTCSRGCCATQLEHYRSVSISAAATPNRKGALPIVRQEQMDKQLAKDLTAYRELRRQHVQPNQIDGAADLAQRAESKVEIEAGTVLSTKAKRKQYRDVMEAVST